jgi:hypothetical protein
MNPFRHTLNLGYGADDQGNHSAIYVLLSLAADVYDADPNSPAFATGKPLDNLHAESLRLLGKYADCHFIKQLAQELPV